MASNSGTEQRCDATCQLGAALSFALVCCATSDVARDRPVLRRRAIAEIEDDLVDVAPAPAFRRIVALDDRMAGRVEVLGGVTVRRAVAAADVAAGPAEAQMHPRRTDLQALLAAERARRHVADAGGVDAFVGHQSPPDESRRDGIAASLREIGVQRGDHLGAFADGGGDALDRSGAHVADGEDAVAARLQRMTPRSEVGARADEALGVERHVGLREPVRVRIGTDEQEEMADRARASLRRSRGCASGRFEIAVLPSSAVTSVCVSTSMFGCAAMRSTR